MTSCCVNHVYTLPLKLSSVIKKFGSGSIFCVFASVTSILIGKDDEYEKKTENRIRKFQTQCAMALTLDNQIKRTFQTVEGHVDRWDLDATQRAVLEDMVLFLTAPFTMSATNHTVVLLSPDFPTQVLCSLWTNRVQRCSLPIGICPKSFISFKCINQTLAIKFSV